MNKKVETTQSFDDNYIWAGSKLVIDNYPIEQPKFDYKTKSFGELLEIITKGCDPEQCFRCPHDCKHKN